MTRRGFGGRREGGERRGGRDHSFGGSSRDRRERQQASSDTRGDGRGRDRAAGGAKEDRRGRDRKPKGDWPGRDRAADGAKEDRRGRDRKPKGDWPGRDRAAGGAKGDRHRSSFHARSDRRGSSRNAPHRAPASAPAPEKRPAPPPPEDKDPRINAYLAKALGRSRRECDDLVKAGVITIDGLTAQLNSRVPEGAVVQWKGRAIAPPTRTYLALNKPAGVITAVRDLREDTVIGLLPARHRSLFPVGRLDRGTRGLLLLTNDGEWANRLMHPRFAVPRTYELTVERAITPAELIGPVALEDGPSKFDSVVELPDGGGRKFRVVLHEGRKRQIRNHVRALGRRVRDLVRTRIGDITLGEIAEGSWRELTPAEVRGVGKGRMR